MKIGKNVALGLLALLVIIAPGVGAVSSDSNTLVITPYADGSAQVTMTMYASNDTPQLTVQILGNLATQPVVADENGNLVPYDVENNTILIFPENEGKITITYYTVLGSIQDGVVTFNINSV
jgi:hypothetical protein